MKRAVSHMDFDKRKDGFMPRRKIPSGEQTSEVVDLKNMQPAKNKEIHVVCKNIKHYREKLGIEQKELGSRIGVIGNTISNWENGYSRPDLNHIPNICKVLNITLYELFGIDDPLYIYTSREQMLVNDYRLLNDNSKFIVDNLVQSLRLVGSIDNVKKVKEITLFDRSLAAGIGDPTEFLDTGTPLYLYESRQVRIADYAFYVNGDSMEPEYTSGDMVLVQKAANCSKLKSGDVGAFIYGNETYIKEYQKDGLHSFNPDYPTMHFDNEASVYFIGKVLCIIDQDYDIADDEDIQRYLTIHENGD